MEVMLYALMGALVVSVSITTVALLLAIKAYTDVKALLINMLKEVEG